MYLRKRAYGRSSVRVRMHGAKYGPAERAGVTRAEATMPRMEVAAGGFKKTRFALEAPRDGGCLCVWVSPGRQTCLPKQERCKCSRAAETRRYRERLAKKTPDNLQKLRRDVATGTLK